VGNALILLRDGLRRFAEAELKAHYGDRWKSMVHDLLPGTRFGKSAEETWRDVGAILIVMDRCWGEIFRPSLGRAERSLINELIDIRNRWAHQQPFSLDDTYRALDSVARLLAAISAPETSHAVEARAKLLRTRLIEQRPGGASRQAVAASQGQKSDRKHQDDAPTVDFESLWADLRSRLQRGTSMKSWSRDKGFLSLSFTIADVEPNAVTVSSAGTSKPRRIGKSEFGKVSSAWDQYCSGRLSRAEILKISHNSSYIFGILKWLESH